MGANKEMFQDMREREYEVNAVFKNKEDLKSAFFKVKGKDLNNVENYLNENTKLISYKTIINTDKLYKEDATFKKLVKIESNARKIKEKYINDKN